MTDDREASTPASATATAGAPAVLAEEQRPPRAQTPARPAPDGRRGRAAARPGHGGSRAPRRVRNGVRLEGRTTTSYPLRDDGRRTVRYLRLVIGQAHIPDEATVAVDVDRITIEWDD